MTGQLCMCYNWDQMNLCYLQCLCYLLLCFFVNSFVACITVVSRGVMIGMSGESWCHKSTLSPICSFPDGACRSSSLLLCFRLRHIICI